MNQIVDITYNRLTKKQILEKIVLYMQSPKGFFHIVSLNPENIVIAHKDKQFADILSEGSIQIFDGVGMVMAAKILGISSSERVTGVDLMRDMLEMCKTERLGVLFIGGKDNLAESLANCYKEAYPKSSLMGIQGFKDINHPTEQEKKQLFSIVADHKPQIIFAAFGSPSQEKWFYEHKKQLEGIICMGVGGGFDFLGGAKPRAPYWMRKIGMEWLYRLAVEPWRWRRQLRILTFLKLVLSQRLKAK
ncbi:MAG: WecB/TagA/CpsF family glycosyltransferase [Weeksellaceae bacterium]